MRKEAIAKILSSLFYLFGVISILLILLDILMWGGRTGRLGYAPGPIYFLWGMSLYLALTFAVTGLFISKEPTREKAPRICITLAAIASILALTVFIGSFIPISVEEPPLLLMLIAPWVLGYPIALICFALVSLPWLVINKQRQFLLLDLLILMLSAIPFLWWIGS